MHSFGHTSCFASQFPPKDLDSILGQERPQGIGPHTVLYTVPQEMIDCVLTVARFLKNVPCPHPTQDISSQCCLFRLLQTGTLLSKQSPESLLSEHLGGRGGQAAPVLLWGAHSPSPHKGCGLACQKDVSSGSKCQHGWRGQHGHFDCSLLRGSRLTGETNSHLAAGLLIERSGSYTLTLSWPRCGRVPHVLLLPRVSAGSSALWPSLCR